MKSYIERLLTISRLGEKPAKDLHRLLYRTDLWIDSYKELSNKVYEKNITLKIEKIITKIKSNSLNFKELDSESFELLQHVIFTILKNVYEPIFKEISHAFRPNKNCHTALQRAIGIKTTWILQADLINCLPQTLKKQLSLIRSSLSTKIQDQIFTIIICECIKRSGFFEENSSYKQSIKVKSHLAGILLNVILHNIDSKIEQMSEEVKQKNPRPKNQETAAYSTISSQIFRLKAKINSLSKTDTVPQEMSNLTAELKRLVKLRQLTQCKVKTNKRLISVRYANQLIIGIDGTHQDAIQIFKNFHSYLQQNWNFSTEVNNLKLVSTKKGYIFLGYKVKRAKERITPKHRRSGQRNMQLLVPRHIMAQWASRLGYGDFETLRSVPRTGLVNWCPDGILKTFNRELIGLSKHYALASRPSYYKVLGKLFWIAELSFVETLAKKYKSSRTKIYRELLTHDRQLVLKVPSISGRKTFFFARLKNVNKNSKIENYCLYGQKQSYEHSQDHIYQIPISYTKKDFQPGFDKVPSHNVFSQFNLFEECPSKFSLCQV